MTSPTPSDPGPPDFTPPAANPGLPTPAPQPPTAWNDPTSEPAGAWQGATPPPIAGQAPIATRPGQAPERVVRGLALAAVGVLAGIIVTVVIWRAGFIASITSFGLAWAAGWLYSRGAGAAPRKGAVPLVALIVIGVALALLVSVASDIWFFWAEAYPDASTAELIEVVRHYLFVGEIWSDLGVNLAFFVAFAALGTFSIMRQLLSRSV